ncbi:MAG: helix-turn-helix domain-containing protein, partial [Verrucomicrobiota bacterium]
LTEQEYEVLVCFIGRAGRVLTRDQLLRSAWKRPPVGRTRTVDRCVAKLRSKIEPDVRRARFLKTIRGVGYRFDPD